MKNIAQNIFWIVITALVLYIVLSKLEVNTTRCVLSVEQIEKILKSGEVIEYEIN